MNPEPRFDLAGLGRRACRHLENVLERVDPARLELLSGELISAGRIVCYGVGREGLLIGGNCWKPLE